MLRLFVLTLILLTGEHLMAQLHVSPDTLSSSGAQNVQVQKLYSDSLTSTFFIVIRDQIALHYHAHHTENVFVVSGKAKMQLGDRVIHIKKGDWVLIPSGTRHAVWVKGKKPLKVLSVQAPLFDGTDRILIKP